MGIHSHFILISFYIYTHTHHQIRFVHPPFHPSICLTIFYYHIYQKKTNYINRLHMIPRLLRPRQENATASFTCEAHGHCLPALLRFCALRALVAGVSGPETGWTPRKSRALKRCSGLVIQRMDWNQEPSQQMMPTSIPPDGRDLGWSNELKWIQRYEWDNRSRSSKWRNISQTHRGTKPLATLVDMLKISHISKPSGKQKKLGMSLQNPANTFAKLRFQIPECSKDILERVNQWQHWLQLGVGQLS